MSELRVLSEMPDDSNELGISEGTILQISGQSGIGKSRLVKLMSGLLKDKLDQEDVFWDSISLYGAEAHKVKISMSVVFDLPALISNQNVIQNLELALGRVDEREISNEQGQYLETWIDEFELKPILNARPAQLSKGQAFLCAWIRALCRRPKILLVDSLDLGILCQHKEKIIERIQYLVDEGLILVFSRATNDPLLQIEQLGWEEFKKVV